MSVRGSRAPRNRVVLALAICLTVALGLASRRYAASLPWVVATYAGDTLWAATAFAALAFLFPTRRTAALALCALGVAYGVECSQLYRAEWLDALRDTRIGALALGSGFLWSDFVCYTAGVAIAAALDAAILSPRRPVDPIGNK